MFRPRRVMRRRAIARARATRGAEPNQEQQAPPELGPDPVDQLKQLHELREQGILTEEEFSAEKKKLLGA
jgi:hypothetical protein